MNASDEVSSRQSLTVNPVADPALIIPEVTSSSKSVFKRVEVWGAALTVIGTLITLWVKSITLLQGGAVLVMLLIGALLFEMLRYRGMATSAEQQLRLLNGQVKVLTVQLVEAQNKNRELSLKLTPSRSAPIVIEGLPMPSLNVEIESRTDRILNQVRVDELVVQCLFKGVGPVRDADLVYRIKGINLASDVLSQLQVSIGGDNLVTLAALNPTYYDLAHDRDRLRPMKPVLKEPDDGIRKIAVLELISPGFPQYEHFDVEFHYTWPAVFNSPKNYWFLHTLDFQETNALQFEVDVGTVRNARVQAYTVGTESKEIKHIGRLHPESLEVPRYIFSRKPPLKDVFYVLLVDGE